MSVDWQPQPVIAAAQLSPDGTPSKDGAPPFVAAYRLRVELEAPLVLRAHVSADERYELWVDGQRIGRGPTRGDEVNWNFESYDIELAPGAHILAARVWTLGGRAPYAQHSVAHGWLFAPDDAALNAVFATGHAPWEARILPGYQFTDCLTAWGTGDKVDIAGAQFAWGWAIGDDDARAWSAAIPGHPAVAARDYNQAYRDHLLVPTLLPTPIERRWSAGRVRCCAALPALPSHLYPIRAADDLPDEARAWEALLRGQSALVVPARTSRRVLLDLEDYLCAYSRLQTSGGRDALVRVFWQESLYDDVEATAKGNRDQVEGKFFVTAWTPRDGVGDVFRPDGGAHRVFEPLWWSCGRYVEVVVQTGSEPLTLETLEFEETRYPLEETSFFAASDARLAALSPIFRRVLQMCSHETFMDCPYYEQLQYIGDTRLQMLMFYALSADDRLARHALRMFDASRLTDASLRGLTQSRYPSRVRRVIAPFSLWAVGALYDFALWRDDAALVRELLPGARRFGLFRGPHQRPKSARIADRLELRRLGESGATRHQTKRRVARRRAARRL